MRPRRLIEHFDGGLYKTIQFQSNSNSAGGDGPYATVYKSNKGILWLVSPMVGLSGR